MSNGDDGADGLPGGDRAVETPWPLPPLLSVCVLKQSEGGARRWLTEAMALTAVSVVTVVEQPSPPPPRFLR